MSDLVAHPIQQIARDLPELRIGPETTEEEAFAAMRMLASFNQCILGMVRFSGRTPWEWHPDDELLYIIDGELEVTLLPKDGGGPERFTLRKGDVYIVPKDSWHRQDPRTQVVLLFVTSAQGNRHSEADDPRESA